MQAVMQKGHQQKSGIPSSFDVTMRMNKMLTSSFYEVKEPNIALNALKCQNYYQNRTETNPTAVCSGDTSLYLR